MTRESEGHDCESNALAAAHQQLAAMQAVATRADEDHRRLAAERDRFAVALVSAERTLQGLTAPDARDDEIAVLRQRLDVASNKIAELELNIATVQASLSWRITAPLRTLRGMFRRV